MGDVKTLEVYEKKWTVTSAYSAHCVRHLQFNRNVSSPRPDRSRAGSPDLSSRQAGIVSTPATWNLRSPGALSLLAYCATFSAGDLLGVRTGPHWRTDILLARTTALTTERGSTKHRHPGPSRRNWPRGLLSSGWPAKRGSQGQGHLSRLSPDEAEGLML